jgi:hypothetical protein
MRARSRPELDLGLRLNRGGVKHGLGERILSEIEALKELARRSVRRLRRSLRMDLENGFRNASGMHGFKRIMPILQAPSPSDDLGNIDGSAFEQ